MADKKLNEVTKVTDMAYVPVIMSDGSIGQIAKADLASVVAGEINPVRDLGSINGKHDSLNDAEINSVYSYNKNATAVSNVPIDNNGVVVTFGTLSPLTKIQIFSSYYEAKIRVYINQWWDWRDL